MKLSLLVFLLVSMLIPVMSNAQDKTPEQELHEMISASQFVVLAYKSGGMSALTGLSQDCYTQIRQADAFECIYIDLGARHIDQPISKKMNWSENKYFSDEQFLPRVAPLFHSRNISMKQANKFLRETTVYINRMVDSEIISHQESP